MVLEEVTGGEPLTAEEIKHRMAATVPCSSLEDKGSGVDEHGQFEGRGGGREERHWQSDHVSGVLSDR